jgi:hypothetical protein
MAEFLTTSGVTYHLEILIKGAREKLILISPFLKLNDRIRQMIEDKDREKIDIRVVYGKNDLQPEENNWLKSKASVRSSFCKNLHAKCFLNESMAVLTSMNLYEFSQVNNEEMGILIKKADDPALYAAVYDDAMRLIRISDEVRVIVERVERVDPPTESKPKAAASKAAIAAAAEGVCIRCEQSIKLDPAHPLCRECYGKWKRYENAEYEEKYCHICGGAGKTSVAKPVCYACYKKNRELVTRSAGR